MGYDTYVSGAIKIKPRLPDETIEELDMHSGGDSDLIAYRCGADDTVGLVDGQIAVIPGESWTGVECRILESYQAYELAEHVRALAAAVKKAGCTATGALYCDGEDSLDLSRIRIEDGKAIQESPKLVWPNGDEGWS